MAAQAANRPTWRQQIEEFDDSDESEQRLFDLIEGRNLNAVIPNRNGPRAAFRNLTLIIAGDLSPAQRFGSNLERYGVDAVLGLGDEQLELVPFEQVIGNIANQTVFHHYLNVMTGYEKQWCSVVASISTAVRWQGTAGFTPGGYRKPSVMLIAPTRAQAIQLYQLALLLCRRTHICPRLIHGTQSPNDDVSTYRPQLHNLLDQHCDLIIGSPGRLLHIVDSHWGIQPRLICIDQGQDFVGKDVDDDSLRKIRDLGLIQDYTSVLVVGTEMGTNNAQAVALGLGLGERGKSYALSRAPLHRHMSELVRQDFICLQDGSQTLQHVAQLVRPLLSDDERTVIIHNTKECAARFRSDLIQVLRATGVAHPERLIGIYTADETLQDNENTLRRFFQLNEIKILIGVQSVANLPENTRIHRAIFIGLPHDITAYEAIIARLARFGTMDTTQVDIVVHRGKDDNVLSYVTEIAAAHGDPTRPTHQQLLDQHMQPLRRPDPVAEQPPGYSGKYSLDCNYCHEYGHKIDICPTLARQGRHRDVFSRL